MNTGGYTPADLQNMGFFFDAVNAFKPVPTLTPAKDLAEVEHSACRVEAAERRSVRAEPLEESAAGLTLPQTLDDQPNLNDRNLNTTSSEALVKVAEPVKPLCGPSAAEVNLNPNRRGKVARLPDPLRHNLNTMLNAGSSYSEIIAWLNTQGYPGFNKVNLHNWRTGGFHDWLRQQPSEPKINPAAAEVGRSIPAEPSLNNA